MRRTTHGQDRPPTRSPFTFARYSVPHEEHIERNEDTLLVDQQRGLAAVFDGVGYGPGHIASQMAARVIRRGWKRLLAKEQNTPALLEISRAVDLQAKLPHLLLEAHRQICTNGSRHIQIDDSLPEDKKRPETTAALITLCKNSEQDGYTMFYAHVGDSRIYLLPQTRPLKRLTRDDGYFSLLLKRELINEDDAYRIDQATSAEQLSAEEFDYFSKRNGITQALGDHSQPTVHIGSMPIAPGDRILLCTDGIHDNLTDQEIQQILQKGSRTRAARGLVQSAIDRSHQSDESIRAKADDMSAIVITYNY
ncbi:PP2C family protein-serine/threonine phosphatase [Ktedonosporobacter rubrisoli]|nr:PP2C family serine/threonine-protein phosphatase [Ktedonosporobacter rubrisoli]